MSALIFIFVLGGLVVVHEFGHFLAAKWVGVRVEKFSIGFGPVITNKKIWGTDFCISLLPLGGFVKLAGESAEDSKGMSWEFNSKGLIEKFIIVFAGPLMNAFLAFVIFSAIFMIGQPILTTQIREVKADSPALEAGLLKGDKITALDGHPVALWDDVLKIVHESSEKIIFTVERDGSTREVTVTPKIHEVSDLSGKKHKLPFVGISPSPGVIHGKNGFFKSLWLGANQVVMLTTLIFRTLGLMIQGAMPFKDSLTGPIGIFFMTRDAANMGAIYLFDFMGSLSVSLFVLNLLPIPVLDGGHVLFILIEKLKGSPLKESVKEKMTQGGLVLLLTLMAFVIVQDVHRFSLLENIAKIFSRH